MELEDHVLNQVLDMRAKGVKPQFIILDQDSYCEIQTSKKFTPSYAQTDSRNGDTFIGVRLASVRGSNKFIKVI